MTSLFWNPSSAPLLLPLPLHFNPRPYRPQALGLSHVADTVVGDQLTRGVSGGERRRVSVGEMWALNTRVFIADRVSDGLDSASTLDLVKGLQTWSQTMGTTIVVVMLQPPPEVLSFFDKVSPPNSALALYSTVEKEGGAHTSSPEQHGREKATSNSGSSCLHRPKAPHPPILAVRPLHHTRTMSTGPARP